ILELQNERLAHLEEMNLSVHNELVASNLSISFLIQALNDVAGNDKVVVAFKNLIDAMDMSVLLKEILPNSSEYQLEKAGKQINEKLRAILNAFAQE
ncbi:hypothetical protein, partial [Providencia stuartii]|uniref:hypothetical protein n=2 Tax=Providencia TaxID=586 RepID=UPI002AA0D934